ncbi:mitochondrial ribosomal protein S25-domain-containing protein [Crucibulum laeve]|uniref:Small ribosomal subunit protein mS23 n=1 Tax=Crucibulum laeve TaxID=68775 RepID=A0A5C3LYF0_9AGAR|nr:mitochondrial ribosomal protein S25-domain-containing protein [Crucibulum laeve]
MVRRIASQVHQQVSRLIRAQYLKREPTWFQAVLDHPPLPLPPKAPPPRTAYDQKPDASGEARKLKKYSTRPLPIYYLEDDIRRQFFRDHPFEAFRPTTLVEGAAIEDPHLLTGPEWTRLSQRGKNPSSETAIQFALNLYQHNGVSLSAAYATAVAQFRALRAERHIATVFAITEAQALGTRFMDTEIEHAFEKEKRSLATWERREELDEGALAARKRWKAIIDKDSTEWSKGKEYVRLWKEGVRPTYSPALTMPVEQPIAVHESADFMQTMVAR